MGRHHDNSERGPEVYAVKRGPSGWSFSRRSLVGAAAAVAAVPKRASAGACGDKTAELQVTAVAISPNGELMASGSDDRLIRLWSLPNGALLKRIKVTAVGVNGLAISPDGRLLASGSSGLGNPSLHLWSLPDGTLLKTLTGHTSDVHSVAISPDGRMLASGSWDGTFKLWSLPDGALLSSQKVELWHLAFSPDGRLLAGALGVVQLWSLPGVTPLQSFPYGGQVQSIAFSPDGRTVATGCWIQSVTNDYSVKLWSVPDGALLKTLTGITAGAMSVAFTPDGRLLASACSDGTIQLWSPRDGTLLKNIAAHSGRATIAISPDGRMLVSGSQDRTIKLWSLPDGKQLPVCVMDPDGNGPTVTGATFTKDGASFTVPCGTPLPAGAVCTCNCVPGCNCVSYSGGCGTVYYYPN